MPNSEDLEEQLQKFMPKEIDDEEIRANVIANLKAEQAAEK